MIPQFTKPCLCFFLCCVNVFHSDGLAVVDYFVDSVWDDSFVLSDIDGCEMLTLLHFVQWWLFPRDWFEQFH